MGMNFGAYFSDFSTMGEIETFCSKIGNLTEFHIDFQENFTLQIRGSKTWRLKRSGLQYPLLGYTPHYSQSGNIEEQSKVHMAFHGQDINKDYEKLSEDVYDVVLDEGDILYHPAGIWHQVECVSDDSISINFSLRQMRIADLITNAQKMILYSLDETRQGIRLDNIMNFQKVTQLGQKLSSLAFDPKYIMPPCIQVPRVLNYDLDKTVQENGKKDYNDNLNGTTFVTLNPFFVLNNVGEMPQISDEAEDAQYVVNGLFGNDDYSSVVRVLVYTQSETAFQICDKIIKLQSVKNREEYMKKRTLSQLRKDLGVETNRESNNILMSLVFLGILVKHDE